MPLLTRDAKGVYPISITPFHDDGAIDLAGMDRLVDFFLQCGVPGITVLGVLGEANKLSEEEGLGLLGHALRRVNGRAQVIAGAGHVGFDNLERFAGRAMEAGAAGLMIAPAPGLKTEEQVFAYFDALTRRIGEATPVALQDYPQHTGVFLSAGTLGALIERHPGIKVVKHEESSALRKISRLRAQEAEGRRGRVSILVGNSGIHLPQELHRGADGANTGVAFPEMLVEVCRRFSVGEAAAGEDLYDLFLPLVRHEQQPGIGLAIRKEIFRRRGLIASARVRAPGPALDADDHAELGLLLDRLDRKLRDAGEAGVIEAYPVAAE
ncbi:dihydrodipicolinate synthase family protein [Bordetella genomosp. 10]|uniref:Dihydrodipicolinate synthase family protein n=1 Tax=Bordetella genomosp. 10 TaxID=1416804 RepID=A0A261S9M7_9BORD|nr:dihydrodipicolinate synthase family protein [Bordetella genomosp. 10]OZI34094.1 dihydrodipicolinate synthase family protein [Bordetella genomosp. 10]